MKFKKLSPLKFSAIIEGVSKEDRKHTFSLLLDYLGLGEKNSYCRLKGFFLKKEQKTKTDAGAVLSGTWFSGGYAKGIVDEFEDNWKCHLHILNKSDKVEREYNYNLLEVGEKKVILKLEFIQYFPLSIYTLLNIQFWQMSLNQIMSRFIVPYDLYTDFGKYFVPKYFLRRVIKDAFPGFAKVEV